MRIGVGKNSGDSGVLERILGVDVDVDLVWQEVHGGRVAGLEEAVCFLGVPI